MKEISKIRLIILILLKLIIAISALLGTYIAAFNANGQFMTDTKCFLYFTIQSNILIALIAIVDLVLLLFSKTHNKVMSIIKIVGTVSISLTGFVFCFVLAPSLGPGAFNIQNILTHVVAPLAAIIDFFVSYKLLILKKRYVAFVSIPPILYGIFTGFAYVYNVDFGWHCNYPYFFLNWGSECGIIGFSSNPPFMAPTYWLIAIAIFVIGLGFLYVFLINKMQKSKGE